MGIYFAITDTSLAYESSLLFWNKNYNKNKYIYIYFYYNKIKPHLKIINDSRPL